MSIVRDNPPDSIVSPEELTAYQVLYDDIAGSNKILQLNDRHTLAELAIITVEMKELRKSINTDGVMMKVDGDRGEVTKRNGACDVLDKRITAHARLLKAFGMAPEYRPKQDGGEVPVQGAGDNFGDI